MPKNETHRKRNQLIVLVGLVVIFLGLFALPSGSHAQKEARFGYSVATTTVDLEVLSHQNDIQYFYGWSFGAGCGTDDPNCYEETGRQVTVEDMWSYDDVGGGSSGTTIYLEVYDNSGNNLIAETSVTISLGSGVNYADSDGDGTINQEENPGCENDPNPDCGEDSDNSDDDNNNDEEAAPPSDGLVNCGRKTEVKTLDDGSTTPKLVNPCGYDDLINLISILIQWLIGILVLVATLMFTYDGFLYLLADGNSDKAQDAKEIFTNVAFGFAIVLVSVLFITTVVTMFTSSSWEDTWMDVVPLPELGMQVEEPSEDDNVYS
jgi:hypothetical protein